MLGFIEVVLRLLLTCDYLCIQVPLMWVKYSFREWDEIEKCATIVKNYLIAVICFCSSFDIKHLILSRALRSAHLPIFRVMKHCKSMRYWPLRLWPLWLKTVTVKGLNLYHSGTWLETVCDCKFFICKMWSKKSSFPRWLRPESGKALVKGMERSEY